MYSRKKERHEPSPKRSYSKAFEPFGWVIGTGNYTDYIDDQVASIEKIFFLCYRQDDTVYYLNVD